MRTGKQIQIFGSRTHTSLEGSLGFLGTKVPLFIIDRRFFKKPHLMTAFSQVCRAVRTWGWAYFFLNELPNLVVTPSDIGLLRSHHIRGKQQQREQEKDRKEKRDLPVGIFMECSAKYKKGFHHLSLWKYVNDFEVQASFLNQN